MAVLQWPNPFDASANTADYDLFLLDESGQREACTLPGLTGVCASTDVQLGGPAPPLEVVTLTNLTGAAVTVTLVINRAAGEALPLVLNLDGEVTLREHGVAAGSVFGHPCLRQALAVGAIDAADPGFDTLEPFSAWGPCALAFPFADTRSKPDLVAADGVDTTLPDFAPFFGTSAAAPHVAAIAALLMEATGGPGARPATAIANALRLLAVDLPPAGPDNRSGHGALVVDAARVQDVLLSGRNTPPQSVIDAPADDVVVAPGTAVAFQGSCVDVQDEDGFAFRWDFSGVAPPSTAPRPVVPFPTTGRFEVTLTCTDRDGAADATPAMRTVTVNEPPQSHIDEPAADVRVTAGSAVRFAGSCSDAEGDEPFAFLWFFGGGTTPASSTQPVPGALVFDTPGTFVVTLRCTDALGLADPTPAAVRITVVAPGGGGGGGCTLLAGQTPALSPWEALGVLLVWLGVPALVRRLGRRRQRRAP
ncbi:MAG: hypothetical protein KatS3mg131_2588 [Candidatus Tectimicrobiota bacterium]|nr:MAG: hypothetical protein KatS3mg131_2588 [Candidatus Tectomicrobia bacterium]